MDTRESRNPSPLRHGPLAGLVAVGLGLPPLVAVWSGVAAGGAGAALAWVAAGLFVLGGALPWVPAAARSAWLPLLRHVLPGVGLLGLASAMHLLFPPTWPALLVLSLGAGSGLAAMHGAPASLVLAAAALGLESLHLLRRGTADLPAVLGLGCACAAVPLLVELMLRGARVRMAQEAKDTVDQRLRALDDDARAYRLIASTTRGDLPMAVRDERRKVGSAVAIGESVYSLMELAARALGSHTCALFLLDPSGKELRVQEMVTRSDLVVTGPIPADKGVLGSVVKRREVVRLHSLRHDFPGITYYHPPDPPTALLAVPVLEGEHLRGVLVCDWKDAREPSAQDASVLGAVAREVIRTVETEAILAQLDLAKQQTDRLFAASREFIGAVTLPQTFEVAIRTARAVSEATAAVLAMREDGKLRVVAADGEGLPPGLLGREVVDDSGLISACMKNQVVLPHGLWEPDRLVNVLGAEAPLKGAQAVRVMPFLEKQESVGVLVVTAPRRNAFPRDVDDRLRVATDMASLSVANARLYARLERMATTDGLTGLLNHRTFQERMTEALQRAERHGRPLGLLLTDIDHFKNVNDTYGHPVGDLVLKNVSAVIKAQARATDTVARYGGEEFAVILEETDIPGGLQMAERIRTAVAASTTDTDMGPLKVTLSLGVAVFPSHGKEKHVIIERADQALYDAKHGGRNRAVVAAPQPPAQEKA